MLEASDVVVCCSKFLAGWGVWRLCSVFLCKRVFSEEFFLQQMLARATRARPGAGKKKVLDLRPCQPDLPYSMVRGLKSGGLKNGGRYQA